MDQELIRFHAVHRRLGGHAVLAGVDFCVRRGETVALVGVNGAGKSTLIKVMLDLRALDSGTIELDGRAHTEREARACLAYLPERFQPPYFLRGAQYLDYMGRLYRHPQGHGEMIAIAEQLGLKRSDLQRPSRTYSKGMAQMLGLAACLLSGRGLLLLDEPMSGLDPAARLRLQHTLARLRSAGRTLFFTTHLMHDVSALADRVLLLHEGRIVADATPHELVERAGSDDLESAFMQLVDAGQRDQRRVALA